MALNCENLEIVSRRQRNVKGKPHGLGVAEDITEAGNAKVKGSKQINGARAAVSDEPGLAQDPRASALALCIHKGEQISIENRNNCSRNIELKVVCTLLEFRKKKSNEWENLERL